MTDGLRERAIALYDAFTHEGRDRRAFLREMTALAGSVAAAEALIASIAASPAAAAIVPADDKRLKTRTDRWESAPGRAMSAYVVEPARGKPKAAVVVVHENRGLNDHIRDVARRMALEGFRVAAPDFLTPVGGTPADENAARDMIGKLDLAATVRDGQSALARYAGKGTVGVTGFCWGGAMTHRLVVAGAPGLAAAVSWYGPAPAPAEASRLGVPLMIHLAGTDERVNSTAMPYAEALRAAGKTFELHEYPGTYHAFNNDTSAERYNEAAAKLAWTRTVAFFRKYLA